jgi:CubicO group peptidase (beta-lactamase class C family)
MKEIRINKMKKVAIILFILSCTFFSCVNNNSNFIYQQPDNIDDGLKIGTLESVNLETEKITNAVKKIRDGKFGEIHSMLILKNNKLVLEEYFDGHKYKWDEKAYHGEFVRWNRTMPHELMSCTKSLTSACIGIAIDKGFIQSVNQSIFDYLPNHQNLKVNNREYITIEHLLTMTSGLAWDEWSVAHGSSANDIDSLWFDCKDTIKCVLDRSWWQEPGKLFTYNGGGTIILSEIIKNATNISTYDFMQKYLLEPLGIENTLWSQFPGGVWDGSGSFHMTPRGMIKLGSVYLNDGLWNDERIISADWVKKSSIPYENNIDINIPGEDSGKNAYGYTWWISKFNLSDKIITMYRAGGWGGQEIMVFPELDMVVVFTGGNYARTTRLYKILEKYILSSVK